MSLFNRNKNSGDVCLVLDIGNASLAVSLVCFEKGQLPRALYTIRVPLRISAHAHADKLRVTLTKELSEALSYVKEKGFQHEFFARREKKIHKVLCVLASPWYVSKTKKIPISNPKPFVITEAFLNDVLHKETEIFTKELKEGLHGEEFVEGVEVMEKVILDAKINGYSIQNPIGQKTQDALITLYMGIGSHAVVTEIKDKLLAFFHTDHVDVAFHSFPLVSFKALTHMFPGEKDYILCDITGEVTDVSLVSGGVVVHTASFPSGKFFLVRKVAEAFDIPPDVAESFVSVWQTGKLHTEKDIHMHGVVNDVEREWNVYLEDVLVSFGEVGALPRKVYLTADTDTAPIFVEFLKIQKTDATASWRKGVMPVHLTEDMLGHFYISPKNLPFDECVALDTIFLSIFH